MARFNFIEMSLFSVLLAGCSGYANNFVNDGESRQNELNSVDYPFALSTFDAGAWYVDRNGNGQWDGYDIDDYWRFGEAGDLPFSGRFARSDQWQIPWG